MSASSVNESIISEDTRIVGWLYLRQGKNKKRRLACDLVVARVKLQYSTQKTKIDGGKIASTPGVTAQIKVI